MQQSGGGKPFSFELKKKLNIVKFANKRHALKVNRIVTLQLNAIAWKNHLSPGIRNRQACASRCSHGCMGIMHISHFEGLISLESGAPPRETICKSLELEKWATSCLITRSWVQDGGLAESVDGGEGRRTNCPRC